MQLTYQGYPGFSFIEPCPGGGGCPLSSFKVRQYTGRGSNLSQAITEAHVGLGAPSLASCLLFWCSAFTYIPRSYIVQVQYYYLLFTVGVLSVNGADI